MRAAWLEMGLDVRIAKGLQSLGSADLVVPHVDLTITPPEYREVLDGLANVVNPDLYDISKRRVSSHLLDRADSYDGPVIVKTDLNAGGHPERRIERVQRSVFERARRKLRTFFGPASAVTGGYLDDGVYRILDSLAAVPDEVFLDSHLVVERFLPELDGGLYHLRWYIFLGDRHCSIRVGSTSPLVKLASEATREYGLPIPREVQEFRARFKVDYGKIDFVMHEGRPVILDLNRTPSSMPRPGVLERARPFAPGVVPLLERAGGAWKELDYQDVGVVT